MKTILLLSLLLPVLLAVVASSRAADKGYPRADLLIEPADLARSLAAEDRKESVVPVLSGEVKRFVVLDARDRKAYSEKRIPGARWVDAAAWAKTFGDGTDAKAWGTRIGELGIGLKSEFVVYSVVVYDDASSKDAARMWWILRYWGVKDVRLLNGGWKGWNAAKLPVEGGGWPRPFELAEFTAVPAGRQLVTKAQLLDVLKGKQVQIVDARSEKEHCGLDPLKNKRAGAIPGAKNLDWVDLLDKDTHRFQSPGQLRQLFQAAGIDLAKPAVAHCQSGGRSSVMVFALELMGAKNAGNYYAGWAEWGNADDTPIVATEAKKKE
jgi:thiosulfate/3-mercaptopyruvate sulfurtransferase